jgi:hypothetical protein
VARETLAIPLCVALIVLGAALFLIFVTVGSPCGLCGPLSMPSPPLDLRLAPFFRIVGGGLVGSGAGGIVGGYLRRPPLPRPA